MSPWKCSAGTQGLHVGPHAHGGSLPLLGMCCDASWSSCPLSSLTCPSIFRRARWSGPPPDPSLSGQVKGGEGGTGAVPHQASADAQIDLVGAVITLWVTRKLSYDASVKEPCRL